MADDCCNDPESIISMEYSASFNDVELLCVKRWTAWPPVPGIERAPNVDVDINRT